MTAAGRPRVIFDCNVFLQAVLSPSGPSYRCLELIVNHRALLLLSPAVLAEARDVLTRPFVSERRPDLTPSRVDGVLGSLTYLGELTRDVPHVQPFPRDPKDEPYLDLAIAARADYLVTRDRDLLSLTSDHAQVAKQFRQRTRNHLRIVEPRAFLGLVGGT